MTLWLKVTSCCDYNCGSRSCTWRTAHMHTYIRAYKYVFTFVVLFVLMLMRDHATFFFSLVALRILFCLSGPAVNETRLYISATQQTLATSPCARLRTLLHLVDCSRVQYSIAFRSPLISLCFGFLHFFVFVYFPHRQCLLPVTVRQNAWAPAVAPPVIVCSIAAATSPDTAFHACSRYLCCRWSCCQCCRCCCCFLLLLLLFVALTCIFAVIK